MVKKGKKEKTKQKIKSNLSDSVARKMLQAYLEKDSKEKKQLQIAPEAITIFKKDILEITSWVAIKAERLAMARGSSRITEEDIKSSMKEYLRRD